jgi:CrcB protein
MTLLFIGLGGAGGAIARYLVDGWVSERTAGAFPFGTLVVNVTGSFLLGVVFAATIERAVLPAEIRGPLAIGFLGAYTTFSTLMLESWRLVEGGAWPTALVNLGLSAGAGLVAVVAGLAIGRVL